MLVFPGEMQRGAAGDKDVQLPTSLKKIGHDRRRGKQMLKVIEHEKEVFALEDIGQAGYGRNACPDLDAQRLGNRGRDKIGIGQRGEIDKEDAITEVLEMAAADLEGQPCLPRAARTGESDHPDVRIAEESRDLSDLRLPSDKRGRLD